MGEVNVPQRVAGHSVAVGLCRGSWLSETALEVRVEPRGSGDLVDQSPMKNFQRSAELDELDDKGTEREPDAGCHVSTN